MGRRPAHGRRGRELKDTLNRVRAFFRRWFGLIIIGPVQLRLSSHNLCWWGFPRLKIGGLTIWSWHSDGALGLAAYHPKGSTAWHWSISLTRRQRYFKGWRSITPPELRRGQWHDYYRLPFGWALAVARQDYHLPREKRGLA